MEDLIKEITLKLKKVAREINVGVKEDDKVRKFNILDYYLLVGSDMRKNGLKLYNFYRNGLINTKEYNTIDTFLNKYAYIYGTRNEDVILKIHFQFNDRIVTDDEKKFILNDLKENDIPITDVIFSLAVRKYVKETAKKEKIKTKKLKNR